MKMTYQNLLNTFKQEIDTGLEIVDASIDHPIFQAGKSPCYELFGIKDFVTLMKIVETESGDVQGCLFLRNNNQEITEMWVTSWSEPEHPHAIYRKTFPLGVSNPWQVEKQENDITATKEMMILLKNADLATINMMWEKYVFNILGWKQNVSFYEDDFEGDFWDWLSNLKTKFILRVMRKSLHGELPKEYLNYSVNLLQDLVWPEIADLLDVPIEIAANQPYRFEENTHFIHVSPPSNWKCDVRCPSCGVVNNIEDVTFLSAGLNGIQAEDPDNVDLWECQCGAILAASKEC